MVLSRRVARFFSRHKLAPRFYDRDSAWVAIRNDGKYWAGEYKWHGRTFVTGLNTAYKWGSLSACECAIRSADFSLLTRGKRYEVKAMAIELKQV